MVHTRLFLVLLLLDPDFLFAYLEAEKKKANDQKAKEDAEEKQRAKDKKAQEDAVRKEVKAKRKPKHKGPVPFSAVDQITYVNMIAMAQESVVATNKAKAPASANTKFTPKSKGKPTKP